MTDSTILAAALEYRKMGWSVIPVRLSFEEGRTDKAQKKPLIDWKDHQTRIASEDELKTWWKKWPEAQIGVVTGKISGLVVLDVDPGATIEKINELRIPPTPTVKTPRGFHYYLKYPGSPMKNATDLFGRNSHIDLRADGGFAVIPPSVYPDGRTYEWAIHPDAEDLAAVPAILLLSQASDKNGTLKSIANGVTEGSRNDSAAKFIGAVISRAPQAEWKNVGWQEAVRWNMTNSPPLPKEELEQVFSSITAREAARIKFPVEETEENVPSKARNSESGADNLLGIAKRKGVDLFHNETGEPYARIPIHDHFEIWPCKHSQMQRWLSYLFYENTGSAPKTDVLTQTVNMLESMASYDGERRKLHNRVAWYEGSFWYDLTDADWRVVRIDGNGWEIVAAPPILFQRYAHQQPQVEPQSGMDTKKILEFVNITNEADQILFLVFLISCFISGFPHPILVPNGQRGSAKSTLFRLIRKIVDPSIPELLSLPKRPEELVQLLSHHWLAPFDNVTAINDATSDALCRAITGDGFSKRRLYSDDEDVIYEFLRCLGLNAINNMVTKPDLLERSLLINLERIPNENRREEKVFWDDFAKARPMILGGIFDLLSRTIPLHESLVLNELPRMADFTRWGCAISEALGYGKEKFLDAYKLNIAAQTEEAIRENPVADALVLFMETQKVVWNGTASVLLEKLKEVAAGQGTDMDDRGWPKGANVLSKKLKELKTTLVEKGIHMFQAGREITLYKSDLKMDTGASEKSEPEFPTETFFR